MAQDMISVTSTEHDESTNGTSKQEAPRQYPNKLVIRSGNRRLAQPVEQIDYLTSAANYVHVYSAGQVLRTRSTFKAIEHTLDPKKFGRVHRGTIVNFDRVKELRALPRGEHILRLNDGTELRMSRSHREQLGRILAPALAGHSPGPTRVTERLSDQVKPAI
jgi:two-component system LytT family response regulator